uniref:Uncharacterized protein n=1 Tax=Anguilla anguilla TaxID=7936 RepID=A0A0E9PGK3_ANGAN
MWLPFLFTFFSLPMASVGTERNVIQDRSNPLFLSF